jgi:putative pyruvate formate lyase activating enzyme
MLGPVYRILYDRNMYEVFLLRPDALSVWEYEVVREYLSWYYSVMIDEKPAKYRIVKRIEAPLNPYEEKNVDELWRIHDRLSQEFKSIWKRIREDELDLRELDIPRYSLLDVKIVLAYNLMKECILCERRCRVNRLEGKRGVCLVADKCIVHSYFHHMGEEAPLVPSGTIFYGGCNFRCVFCQNYDVSQTNVWGGEIVTPRELARIQEYLRRTGARNINHVGGEPTPHLPFIIESFKYTDINVPQLWNSNMYLTVESMKLLVDLIDIWLPDFKYGNDECAWRLSRVKNYWSVVTRNLRLAYGNGDMIIRHLVLPNHIECCTRPVLEWIARNTPRVLVNIMDQYTPMHLVARYPEKYKDIARRPSIKKIREAFRIADELGLVYEPVSR